MTISTLEEARKWQKLYPNSVEIMREVRYSAVMGNTHYRLVHDFTVEMLDRKLWEEDSAISPSPPVMKEEGR